MLNVFRFDSYKIIIFSSNLYKFDKTESQFSYFGGSVADYNNSLVIIGGYIDENSNFLTRKSRVEEIHDHLWQEHIMSPVGGLNGLGLAAGEGMKW